MKTILAKLVDRIDLNAAEMDSAMEVVFSGQATPSQIAGFLIALRMKGETALELTAAARAMRRHALAVKARVTGPLLDTCGTGGDGSGTFNISTLTALVVSAAGVAVAKHGNRAATSQCGSADLLEALGVRLDCPSEQIARSIEQLGIGFMFARAHHPALRHAAAVRSEIGVRTLFNAIAPMCNPAGATHQLLGVGDGNKLELAAAVLRELGTAGAWVVHGDGGLDEVSLCGPTQVIAIRSGSTERFTVAPEDFGIPCAPLALLAGGDATANARTARAVLEGQRGAIRDAVILNAAAALCVAEVETDKLAAAERARAALDSGAALAKLRAWIAFGA